MSSFAPVLRLRRHFLFNKRRQKASEKTLLLFNVNNSARVETDHGSMA